ncbi:hypothetical protein Patl1_15708 [Pistacia atlantica]|uniref:Uncharacterized protein n=1 Tax=Pistacia atlantica TaxID=434234 RepID=A0ACC1B7F0_9ROSI|nr:hypothetical protein Patl1_15708 [Pistacia atlantica]
MKGKVVSHFVLNTGAKIPAIGLGTWQSGGELCVEAVKTALLVGYRHIDCAHLYGNEIEVGEALDEAFKGSLSLKREDVFLTSTLYCTMNSLNKIENYVELHPFWRQDELVKFCQSKGIHVSAHTPLGVPTSSPGPSDSGSGGEDEAGTPRISFRRSRSVHGPMLKLSAVAEIADRHKKTPEQVIFNHSISH